MKEREFAYKEDDREGLDTLDVIAEAGRFNQWMYRTIQPHCSGNIIEIGSGIGNISQFFLQAGASITLSDIRPHYCDALRTSFSSYPNLQGVVQMDLVHPAFDKQYANHLNAYDSLFSLNVVEHIKDDRLALSNAKKLLKPNGTIVVLVPAYQSLYNQFDKGLEHYRRYTKKTLTEVVAASGFEVKHRQYFNFMGIFGWYVSGKLQKNDTIPRGQMGLYNKLVPAFKVVDWMVLKSMGLSVIVVGKNT